jgi:hypothetical protein
MKLELKLLLSFTVILLLSSCGVITKARYGNGFKLNIESNLFARKDKSEAPKTPAKKKTIAPQVSDVPIADAPSNSTDSFASITSIQSGSSTEIPNTNSALIEKKKTIKKVSTQPKNVSKALLPKKKIEPNVALAAVLFYGAILSNLLIYGIPLVVSPFVSVLLGVLFFLGLLLALIGLKKIKKSETEFSGRKLAKSIIYIFFGLILYMILAIAVFAIFY